MSGKQRRYDHEFKIQAVKLVKETGTCCENAAAELGIPASTLYGWIRAHERGVLEDVELSGESRKKLTASQEIIKLRKEVEQHKKRIAELEKEKEVLAEATAFFAASRRKSGKN